MHYDYICQLFDVFSLIKKSKAWPKEGAESSGKCLDGQKLRRGGETAWVRVVYTLMTVVLNMNYGVLDGCG